MATTILLIDQEAAARLANVNTINQAMAEEQAWVRNSNNVTHPSDVIDDVHTTVSDRPLSANMGRYIMSIVNSIDKSGANRGIIRHCFATESIYAISTVVITNGGSGYSVNDSLNLVSDGVTDFYGLIRVTSVNSPTDYYVVNSIQVDQEHLAVGYTVGQVLTADIQNTAGETATFTRRAQFSVTNVDEDGAITGLDILDVGDYTEEIDEQVITLLPGSQQATIETTMIQGGMVTGLEIINYGEYINIPSNTQTLLGGHGEGITVDVSFVQTTSSTLDSIQDPLNKDFCIVAYDETVDNQSWFYIYMEDPDGYLY